MHEIIQEKIKIQQYSLRVVGSERWEQNYLIVAIFFSQMSENYSSFRCDFDDDLFPVFLVAGLDVVFAVKDFDAGFEADFEAGFDAVLAVVGLDAELDEDFEAVFCDGLDAVFDAGFDVVRLNELSRTTKRKIKEKIWQRIFKFLLNIRQLKKCFVRWIT